MSEGFVVESVGLNFRMESMSPESATTVVMLRSCSRRVAIKGAFYGNSSRATSQHDHGGGGLWRHRFHPEVQTDGFHHESFAHRGRGRDAGLRPDRGRW